jgi:hypothetical protein
LKSKRCGGKGGEGLWIKGRKGPKWEEQRSQKWTEWDGMTTCRTVLCDTQIACSTLNHDEKTH